MLPMTKYNKRIASAMLFIVGTIIVSPVFAVEPAINTMPPISNLSAQSMLVNIGQQIPNLTRLITAFAFVIGFYFVMHGITLLKHAGEMRTQMSHEHHLTKPIAFITIGSLLIYLPSAVQVGLSTFWADPNPYGYLQMQDQWSQFINVCFLIVQFVGTLAFIRGLMILRDIGGHGGQQSSFAKGMTHIVGGILCINIYQFVQVVLITLGIQTL